MSYSTPNILIVDDNILNLQVTTEILKEKGYRIGLAQSGFEALRHMEVQIPDLILLDIMMPDMDGIETCKRIKKNPEYRDLPIIFLTAKNQTEDIVNAFNVGGFDYITKPFQPKELIVRVKNHIELYHSKIKIKELIASRDKLYSIIAHDIKTPFSNISFIISALKDKHIDPNSEDFDLIINELEKTTNSASELLKDLFHWARYQSGMINPVIEKCNLNTFVLETEQLLQSAAKNKNIKTSFELADDCYIYADGNSVKTIIRNLYTNAIKFSKQGENILIKTSNNKNHNLFEIIDYGVGMNKEILDKILINQENHTTPGTNNEAGTGLGLRLVQDFVELNNAKMHVDSKPNEGTHFTITFNANPI